jgi:sugar lactone lactonase YvrE
MTTLGTSRPRAAATAAAALGLALVAPALTAASSAAPPVTLAERAAAQRVIDLPDGFEPEGVATNRRTAYFGSLADGDIYAYDLVKRSGSVISEGPGTSSVGLAVEPRQNRLYVAGGDAGTARVVDAGSGDIVADYTLSEGPAFVNDVILTRKAAWFTNSAAAELYRVPITKKGRLPRPGAITTVPLRGDWTQPEGFGANGITRTPDGSALLVVNSADGTLFRVETKGKRAGRASLVDLGGQSLTNGDGMLQQGRTLYVVRNRLNKVVQLRVAPDGLRGRKVRTLTSPSFDVPTTIAAARGRLYLPNARFGTEATPTTPYTVSVLRKR